MNLNLQNTIFTPQDLKALIMEVRSYTRWFAQANIKSQVVGKPSAATYTVSETAATLIREFAAGQPLSQQLLDMLILSLEKIEKESPRITITLAAMPGNSLKKSLTDWCRKNVSPDVLVDFRFNATLLGGMVVQYGSRIHDWSFRRAILANRSKFPGVLRNV